MLFTIESPQPIDPRAMLPDGPYLDAYGKRLAERAVSNALAEPKSFDMSSWVWPSQETACGTVACFAGHVVLAAGIPARSRTVPWALVPPSLDARLASHGLNRHSLLLSVVSVPALAEALLGLEWDEGDALFFLDRWPLRSHSGTDEDLAEELAARLRVFAETGQ